MKIRLPREYVDVSDYTDDGPILVRAMTAEEEAELYGLAGSNDEGRTNLMLVARVTIHDDGSALFDEQGAGDLPGGLVRRIADVSLRLSGFQDDETEVGKDAGN